MFGNKTTAVTAVLIIVVSVLYNVYFTKKELSLTIETRNGRLFGIVAKSRNGRNYYSYLRIPYAKPPVGELRFEPPQPPLSWDGVRDGSFIGPRCLQFDLMTRKVDGEEDCLILNVHTPKIEKNSKLSVMVFFHGGIFHSGSGSEYTPKYFMDEDVIIVTVNYRLGALGFLNTADGKIKGNMGLKDQTKALIWVQENINHFGGNANSVTIFGESAGASSVHYHILSPLSKGLFHRAISQSGTALAHWALTEKSREQALRLAGQFNCPTQNPDEMVACLKSIPAFDLAHVHKEVLKPLREWITLYSPTIETVQDEDTFMPPNLSPSEILRSGKINRVPWISGINSEEGLLVAAGVFRNESLTDQLALKFPYVGATLLSINASEKTELLRIQKHYIGNEGHRTADPMDNFHNYTNLFSDRMFFVPVHNSAKIQAQSSKVYLYHYSYKRETSLANFILASKGKYPVILEIGYLIISTWVKRNILGMTLPNYGVCHADELAMFFIIPWDAEIKPGGEDYDLSVEMVKLWTSFANAEDDLRFNNTDWRPIQSNSTVLKYLDINRSPSIIDEPFSDRIALWDSIKLK